MKNIWIQASCPARVDLFGGWTDTPPICYVLGGAVINAAISIDGKRPIFARCRRITEKVIQFTNESGEVIVLETIEDLKNYCDPLAPGALLKACLVGSEFIDLSGGDLPSQLLAGGVEILTKSDVPYGSGLGTSSILAACIVAVLWKLQGKETCQDWGPLLHCVLRVEQLLTTGGGWQDQVGGVVGGVKIGRSSCDGNFAISYEPLKVDANLLNERLLMVYTGKTRLAKNLLQTVLKNWHEGKPEIVAAFQGLLAGIQGCALALESGDVEALGKSMNKYWELKKILATDAEPPHVSRLLERVEPYIFGGSLAGAGGGGFLLLVLKTVDARHEIAQIIMNSQDEEIRQCSLHNISLDFSGLQLIEEFQEDF